MLPIVAALAQAVPPPAPPAPPSMKSGTFKCEMFDRAGRKFKLSGVVGNHRRDAEIGGFVADVDLKGPANLGLTFRTTGPMSNRLRFSNFDRAARLIVSGELEIPYGPQGRLTLDRVDMAGSGRTEQYIGFCDTSFTSAPKALP